MKIIFGLGNPGEKYRKTRHNIGFRIIEEFARENNFPKFKAIRKFNAEISERVLNREKIILSKPQTFMNLSGKAVKSLTDFYHLPTTNLYAIHDDIDLPLGKIRIAIGRGGAGHKGVESIIKELKTKNFVRLRIGIHPSTKNMVGGKPKNVERFVLQKFNNEEEKIVEKVIKKTIEAIEMLLKEGPERVMSRFN